MVRLHSRVSSRNREQIAKLIKQQKELVDLNNIFSPTRVAKTEAETNHTRHTQQSITAFMNPKTRETRNSVSKSKESKKKFIRSNRTRNITRDSNTQPEQVLRVQLLPANQNQQGTLTRESLDQPKPLTTTNTLAHLSHMPSPYKPPAKSASKRFRHATTQEKPKLHERTKT